MPEKFDETIERSIIKLMANRFSNLWIKNLKPISYIIFFFRRIREAMKHNTLSGKCQTDFYELYVLCIYMLSMCMICTNLWLYSCIYVTKMAISLLLLLLTLFAFTVFKYSQSVIKLLYLVRVGRIMGPLLLPLLPICRIIHDNVCIYFWLVLANESK